jgi:hypothetical protein
MHGKDVKLVREKHAVYDISWDNDGTDSSGIVRLEKCVVEAYVWARKAQLFDYNAKLTRESTLTYCRELEHRVH